MVTPDSVYRVGDGEDRISREKFRQLALARFAKPVLAERDPGEYYDAIIAQRDADGKHADALLVLLIFEHESTYGKAGAATETKSWGNTRPPSYGAPEIGKYPQYVNGKLNGFFSIYGSWLDGAISTAMRLVHPAAPYAGRQRIIEIFEHPSGKVWAPAGDFNNPASYIGAVIGGMNRDGDRITSTPTTPRRVAKPVVRTDKQTPNRGGYDTPRMVEAICKHISDGSEVGDLSWMMNPTSGAGCNYYITKAGVIYEMCSPYESAWTNGPRKNPDRSNPLIRAWDDAKINPNTRTVSEEFEGKPGDRLTVAQIKASNHLDAWLSEEFPAITLDRTHLIGHYQIDSVDRSYCPSFDDDEWIELINGALAYFAETETPPNRRDFDVPGIGHFSVAGGFLRYYEQFGGLDRDGYPVTNEFVEHGLTVQYFERSRYEWHPGTWPERWDVLRGRLGAECLTLARRVRELETELAALRDG